MISPGVLVQAIVDAYRASPGVTALIAADDIAPYFGERAEVPFLLKAVYAIKSSGGILVSWDGFKSGSGAQDGFYAHRFSVYVKPPRRSEIHTNAPSDYYEIFKQLLDAVPSGQSLPLLTYEVVDNGVGSPKEISATRQSMIVDAAGNMIDYFRVQFTLEEKWV